LSYSNNEDTMEDVRKTAEDVFFLSGHSFFYSNLLNVPVTTFDKCTTRNVWKTFSWPTEISDKDVMVFMKKYQYHIHQVC
jgi:hypothetical protein